ncbi:hypothetical protein [Thermoactinomyces sp. CICC 10521]|jgi:hypothetical protein|uniref:hypothetical protein n=1 Tax=Thermoactinomyces sp. CICC 10521 TaxID=2767426 RepID=UPI0018DE48A9|nr:hypothetical protein [Thermoactinomyces sp. CICC 10521]MBH8607922.1 hypothetical protein [Thermoactinomyces sp. CICC 10521]
MLTPAHWLYGAFTLLVILAVLFRRGVVLLSLVGTLLVAWVYKGSFVDGLQAIFNANLVAANELFSIFLIITFMVALLRALKDLGADRQMIAPIQRLMVNGHVSFFILVVITYVISLFFWPTPAVPLIGALLIPPAVRAGLPAMGAAMAVAVAGQGMALSSDYVMQVAPMLSAKSAGINTAAVADKALILSLVTGVIASGSAYLYLFRKVRNPDLYEDDALNQMAVMSAEEDISRCSGAEEKWGRVFAVLVPFALLGVMLYMVYTKIHGHGRLEGANGAAFIGGVAAVLLIMATFVHGRFRALERISEHIVEGFLFSFKAMGPVVPIAGFFFLGNGDFAGAILSVHKGAPAFLFDIVKTMQAFIPANRIVTSFGILLVGMVTGLEGSGFSGLPLTGALSGALASSSGFDPSTLAAIGQMGSVWTGGGTLIAWSSLVAVAGFAGVPVMELARKNAIPVIMGLVVSTLVAVFLW